MSVVIGEIKGLELHIDLWIMSCRVLKRDMEYAMMDRLAEEAQARGLHSLYGYYYPTAKNAMVRDFYSTLGFDKISEDEAGNTCWKFDLTKPYTKKNMYISVNEGE